MFDGNPGRRGPPRAGLPIPSSTEPVSSSSVSATSRTTPRTRRTMLPTAISRGCAAISCLPTSRIRLISDSGSVHLALPASLSKRCVVAIAHGREFLICRRFRSETRSSIDLSTGCALLDLRKVASEGALPQSEVTEGMLSDVVVCNSDLKCLVIFWLSCR